MEKLKEVFIFLSMYLLGMTANLQAHSSNEQGILWNSREGKTFPNARAKIVHYNNLNYQEKLQNICPSQSNMLTEIKNKIPSP